ncbi:MAG: tRNA adenosine deaminase-associated protein [Propionibacteriaceae bacterium]|nr:tRNA adenosine deaminase-associated protein [Propionibacteriaceae bacterium]
MPNRGDDRPGIDELDDPEFLDDPDDEYPEDATEDDIDIVCALYREDGQPLAVELEVEYANDLDALIKQLRRIPGEAGALGMISIDSSVFVLVRVRGKKVQVYLSDILAAYDWPIARDIADYLNEELPDEDDDSEPIGDAEILSDVGVSDFDLENFTADFEEDTLAVVRKIAKRIGYGSQFKKLVPE